MRDSTNTPNEPGRVRLGRLRKRATAEMLAAIAEGRLPKDPGLRERFATLPRAPIRLIAPHLAKDVNQGGLLRLAEAFRLECVDFEPTGTTECDLRGAVGAKTWQPHRWIAPEKAIAEARERGFRIVALSLEEDSNALERMEWTFPIALVVGCEDIGVPNELRALCDESVAIPMYGMVDSLNVSVSAGIVVHHMVSAYRRSHPEFVPAREASLRLLE